MGQELAADSPFLFFCDFGPDLADAVTRGRRREFARFARFTDDAAQQAIPDPNDPVTFERSKLDWSALDRPQHHQWFDFHRNLLALRRAQIVPRLAGISGRNAAYTVVGETGLTARWRLGDDSELTLFANLGNDELIHPDLAALIARQSALRPLFLEPASAGTVLAKHRLPAWTVVWYLRAADTDKRGHPPTVSRHDALPRHRAST